MVKQAVKERPILFTAPMVQAILEGRKTMTRRIVTDEIVISWMLPSGFTREFVSLPENHLCRYGYAGDRLWVREKWRVDGWDVDTGRIAVDYAASPDLGKTHWRYVDDAALWERLWIQSTDDAMAAGLPMDEDGEYHWEPGCGPCRWRPSIFMPRAFSRITLEITNVRVERLNDISTQDVFSEGMEICTQDDDGTTWGAFSKAQARFMDLWESINGPGSWDENPYVWVIEFKRIEQ